MITRIEAGNYRCFRQLSVDVSGYQVVAGANGAGKSTLLDIPMLVSDLLRAERVADAVLRSSHGRPRASDLRELLHRGQGTDVVLALEAQLPADVVSTLAGGSTASRRPLPTHLRYEVRLAVFNRGLQVAEEHLFLYASDDGAPQAGFPMQGREVGASRGPGRKWWPVIGRREGGARTELSGETTTRGPRLELRIDPEQLALASVPADETLFPAARWFVGLLRGRSVTFDPDWDLLRRAAPPGDPTTIVPDGRNTPWLARALREDDPEGFELWVDHVRTALPQVSGIDVHVREDDSFAYFALTYAGGHRVTSSGLSDGTVRVLALTLLPYLPDGALPRLLVTEEPENGIHPQAIETVLTSLQAIRGSQVWISTHSPIVLARTELADILAARLHDDGSADVVHGNAHPRLRDWQGGLDLGSLFASGVLS